MKNDRVVVEGLDGISVVTLRGDFDIGLAQEVEQVLTSLMEEGSLNVVIDMTHVGFIGSTTIGVLLGCAGRIRRRKGELKICGVPQNMKSIFKVLGVGKFIAVCEDRTAALLASPQEVRQRLGLNEQRQEKEQTGTEGSVAPARKGERKRTPPPRS